jgi:hypothetical protein
MRDKLGSDSDIEVKTDGDVLIGALSRLSPPGCSSWSGPGDGLNASEAQVGGLSVVDLLSVSISGLTFRYHLSYVGYR